MGNFRTRQCQFCKLVVGLGHECKKCSMTWLCHDCMRPKDHDCAKKSKKETYKKKKKDSRHQANRDILP